MLHTQAAYREGRSCPQQFCALHLLVQRALASRDEELHVVFVDFSRAFDAVSYAALRATLNYWSVPANLTAVIFEEFKRQTPRIRWQGSVHPTELLPTSGVLQGDTLAPFLFILVIDLLLRGLPLECGILVGDDRQSRHLVKTLSQTHDRRHPHRLRR